MTDIEQTSGNNADGRGNGTKDAETDTRSVPDSDPDLDSNIPDFPDAAPSSGIELDLDRETFERFARSDGDDRPVVVRTVATLDVDTTPLAAYAALTGRSDDSEMARSRYAFLLESAEKTASSDPDGAFRPGSAHAERHARYSFVGYDPDAVLTVDPDGTSIEILSEDAPRELLTAVERRSNAVRSARTEDGEDDEAAIESHGYGNSDGSVGTRADEPGDTLDAIRAAMPDVRLENVPDRDRQQLGGGLVGFIAYEAVYDLWLSEVGLERPETTVPDAAFVLTTKTIRFDERDGTISIVFTPILESGDDPGSVFDSIVSEARSVRKVLSNATEPEGGEFVRERERSGSRETYEEHVRRAKEHVLDGDIYQGVISRTREITGQVDPIGFYDAMRAVNPSPYMYLLDFDDLTVVGASPETLISVRGQTIMSNPIAGTCDRGESPVEDRRLAGEMLADGKERAEHTMLVDLARNDVRRVAEPGSVRVEEFMNVLKYSHVQHIESTVTGALRSDADAFDATRAAFPAGTLSGAPKVRAMEIIDELEVEPRGLYGGGVGYFSWTGDADFAIVIRTATIERCAPADERSGTSSAVELSENGVNSHRITVQAGAGLVADSDPRAEYEETEKKMGGVLAALSSIEVEDTGSDVGGNASAGYTDSADISEADSADPVEEGSTDRAEEGSTDRAEEGSADGTEDGSPAPSNPAPIETGSDQSGPMGSKQEERR